MIQEDEKGKTLPNCFKCHYFFITHEPAHPYGCRAMGFKSPRPPSEVVLSSSGVICQVFEEKKKSGYQFKP